MRETLEVACKVYESMSKERDRWVSNLEYNICLPILNYVAVNHELFTMEEIEATIKHKNYHNEYDDHNDHLRNAFLKHCRAIVESPITDEDFTFYKNSINSYITFLTESR
jgi:hypothetical protein